MKIQIAVRIAISAALLAVAAIVTLADGEAGLKAPLLTMVGALIVLVSTFPEGKPTLKDLGIILGSGTLILGSYFWLLSETPDDVEVALVIILAYVVVALALIAWFILWVGIMIWAVFQEYRRQHRKRHEQK